jgi:EAL domain-containing protein (putative c-di-GMP-specific phosphodiesterase class I)
MLILEDDLHVGRVVKLTCESGGLESRLLTDPALFFRAVDEWKPTHIVLDLVMPDMDGVQVLTQLASRHCTAKIIIISGMGVRVLEAAQRAGSERGLKISGVLSKPFTGAALRKLLDATHNLLGHGTPAPAVAGRRKGSTSSNPTKTELRRALDNQEFKLVYQPKIECATGRLAGFEALARWVRPDGNTIMPDRFIPQLERRDLIDALTEAVLDQALPWFSGYLAAVPQGHGAQSAAGGSATNPTLSINFSAKTFTDDAFLDRVTARCLKLKIAPHRLIFELTERNSMDDPTESLSLMTRVRMKGFHLSIDDFGTGYSSLLQLVRLPFSEIKVDKSFVVSAHRSTESRTVVKSIVDLGRSLGLISAAEGVEDADTLEYLKEIGCDLAQGFFIARPMEGDAVHEWVRNHALQAS